MFANLKLAKPTIIAAIAYIVMGCIILMPINIGTYDPNYDQSRKFDLTYRIILLIILLIPIGFSLYSINCMMNGKCVMWSYINAVAICIWVVLFFVASLVASERSTN